MCPVVPYCLNCLNKLNSYNFLVIVSKTRAELPFIHATRKTTMPFQLILICRRCGRRVPVETCKIDEYGDAVHEECAVSGMQNNHTAQHKRQPFPLRLQMLLKQLRSQLSLPGTTVEKAQFPVKRPTQPAAEAAPILIVDTGIHNRR